MLKNTRDPELALWQSAVDEVVAKQTSGSNAQDISSGRVIARPDVAQSMVAGAALDVNAAEKGTQTPLSPPAKNVATEDLASSARYCSNLARNAVMAMVQGNASGAAVNKEQLTAKMGDCDPRWAEAAMKYAEFLMTRKAVSYTVYKDIGDFVLEMDDTCRVGIIGDWGTGQDEAKRVLAQMARKQPDIAIHLGDIYYSCTDFEATNYFYNIWTKILPGVRSYNLTGNHDMFSGGAAYYDLISKLGQPASYFCLRNKNFQIIALDTSYNDRVPGGTVPTFLQDTEVAWLKDKIRTAGDRKTILLSHHQLFSAWEDIGGGSVNQHLLSQVEDILPRIDLWIWGHEHNQVIYEPWRGLRGRCVGHGAFPIGTTELGPPKFTDVPIVPGLELGDNGVFMNHGYVILEMKDETATVSYYQDSDEDEPMFTETVGGS